MARYEARTWRLARGLAIDPARPVTARFVDGTLSGSIGDVHYRAQYDAGAGDEVRIGPLSTSRAGEDAGFATLLGSVATARVAADRLELLDRGGDMLLAFEAAPDVPESLVGRWTIGSVRTDDGDVAVQDAWIEIAPDGTVTGSGGVNRLGGRARADGDRLYLGPLRSTRMGGADAATDSESAVLRAFEEVATFRATGRGLELRDADDEVVMRLGRG